jgi:IMP dehydrogenase/GMP reductase
MRKTLCSDDFLLVPKYSDIKSRKEVDLAVKLSDDIHGQRYGSGSCARGSASYYS